MKMRLQEFFEDKKAKTFSATRLGFLLWVIGVLVVWVYASWQVAALQSVPESVVTILGLLATGKVVQRYGEG